MPAKQPMRVTIIVAALATSTLAADHPVIAQSTPVWGTLEPGPYQAGYRVIYELDRSRIWRVEPDSQPYQETARPIRISVWYPAEKGTHSSAMTLAEFVQDSAPSPYFDELNHLLEGRFVDIFSGVSRELYDTLLTLPLATVKNAVPASGSFPLVLYSPGGQASFPDNGVLSSYLASHGYVVASVPQLGAMLEGRFRGYGRQAQVQTRDIEFAAGVMRDFPGVDPRRVAVVGYSLGGTVALRVALNNPNVDAIVGLDPSFAYARSIEALVDPQSFDVFDLRIPVLSLQAGNEESQRYHSQVIHDTLRFSDRYIGKVAATVHGDFSEIKPMLIPAIAIGEELDPALVNGHHGYMASCRYVLNFLNSVLKQDTGGASFVAASSGANGMEAGLVQMELRHGAEVPTEAEFAASVRQHGYETTSQLLRSLQTEYPDLAVVREDVMNGLAHRLLAAGDPDPAIGVFRLNIQVYPNSARAHDGLADTYLSKGDSLMVIRTYERLLEILPNDTTLSQSAKNRLRQNAELRLQLLRHTRPGGAGGVRFPA
ncbi:MAG: dienelactone hydrolase family protein [Gemmatimonadota bacterium]|nr:MAG: dienelactone hydrolase family protein [Gemmatimonadota bacterium]